MPTFTIPSGRQIYNPNDGNSPLNQPTADIVDAETNNPFFLQDWLAWEAAQTNRGWRDPCVVTGLASGFVWEGGRFYGNISRTQDRTGTDGFYTSGRPERFNGALWFPQISVPGTIRNAEFGILDDLDSGFCDGIRAVQMGAALTVENCVFSSARDDCIESDGQVAPLNITNSFFENVYSWVSATGNGNDVRNKVITITDSLCRFRAWPESNGQSQIGPVFKIDGAGNAPVFRMTNVTLHIPNFWPETGFNRTRGALSRMVCSNCDLLVSGGPLSNNFGLRDAFIAAGWNLIEDTDQANTIWATRKDAYFGAAPPPPPEPGTVLTSPVTFRVNVGTPTLTAPVLLGTEISGTNTPASSFDATNPAYSAGDLVLVFVMNDGGSDRVGTPAVTVTKTDLSTETITTEQAILSDGTSGADGHTISCFSFVATEGKTSGSNIACSISGGLSATEQFTVVVMVFDDGTFNPVTRLLNKTHTFSTAGGTDLLSGVFTATKADSRIIFVAARAFDAVTTTPSGWTQRANTDPGALPGYAATRDALTTAAESVAEATFSGSGTRAFVGLTVAVNPKATYS